MEDALNHEMLRELVRTAHEVRVESNAEGQPVDLRLAYTLCFEIGRRVHKRFPDLRIMVGDRISEKGVSQHHWLEFPSGGIFLDPAYDDLDPFQAVRIGHIEDEDYAATYPKRLDSNFKVDNPRDRPELVYKVRTAFDREI